MKQKIASLLTAVMVLGLLSVPAFAYTAEVSELNSVTPSNSYIEVSTCTHYDGEHPLYIFPAGTTFQSAGYMVVQAWKIESDTGALDFYDSDYSASSDGATFVPEPGVIYMLQESNQMDWFQYMYIMVEGGGTTTEPEPEPEQIFSDVAPDAWYAGFVETVYEKNLFAGTGDGTFAPEANMTYAEFLTVLSQFSGETLTPVFGGAWYDTYVQWAQPLIPAGMAENFDPVAPITRQDMAALFGTFLSLYDYSADPVNPGQAEYTDAASIADYAESGVQLCYQLGIMSGGDDGSFAPLAKGARAQMAGNTVQTARVMGR